MSTADAPSTPPTPLQPRSSHGTGNEDDGNNDQPRESQEQDWEYGYEQLDRDGQSEQETHVLGETEVQLATANRANPPEAPPIRNHPYPIHHPSQNANSFPSRY